MSLRDFNDILKEEYVKVTYLEHTTDILKVIAIKMGQGKKDEVIALRDLYYYPKMRGKEQIKEIKL